MKRLNDQAAQDGKASAHYETMLPSDGNYEVRISWPPNKNRSSKVAVTIVSAEGVKTVSVNQQQPPHKTEVFRSLGVFRFESEKAATVTISNEESDGYVVIDAVQWLKE